MKLAYALIGPPTAGKTTIEKELRKYGIPAMVSYTTRPPRSGETEGVDYYFVTRETFSKTEMIEKVSYSGNFYGLAKNEVIQKTDQNPISVVSVDRHGLDQLKKLLGKRLISIFILVDEATIIDRVLLQGGNPEQIQERINYAKAAGEFDQWQIADYVVKNTSSLDSAVRQILAIMDLVQPKPPAG